MRRAKEPAIRCACSFARSATGPANRASRVANQMEPALEVLGLERMPSVQREMDLQSVTPVESGVEEDCLPEIAHDRQVALQVEPGNIREQGPDRGIAECRIVERYYQVLNVGPVDQIPHVLRVSY